MIGIKRKWKNGRLVGAHIATSGKHEAKITWAKNGEATISYGEWGKKPRRWVGVLEGFEFGDGDRRNGMYNVVELHNQTIIKKCDASLLLDGVEMPADQMVFDLNRSYMSREEKRAAESAISQIVVDDQNETELRKLALVGVLFNLSQEEAKEVMKFATQLKTRNQNAH